MARVDVTIRGAGIFGLSAAWACVCRGATVRVVDPGGPGAGASGGVVGALAPHVPENWNDKKAFQLESLFMAEPFWAAVEQAGGVQSGYARLGRVQPLADARAVDLARSRAAGAKTLWQGRAEWTVVGRDDVPGIAPSSPSGLYVFDTLSARLHPRRACAALVAALQAQGCDIVSDAVEDGAVVWATGWQGLRDLSTALGRPVGDGVKGQAVLLDHDAGGAAQVFADGLHVIPHEDGTVAIGSTSERDFQDAAGVDEQCDDLIARAMAALPVLRGAPVLERWAGVRPRARSRAPVLGAWPGRAGHYVLNGGFKIGFGMAPKLAACLADLVLEGRDSGLPKGFRVDALL